MGRFDKFFEAAAGSRVLDIGGTPSIWGFSRANLEVTLLNLGGRDTIAGALGQAYVTGSALALPFADGHFDIAFSNSVIEHVGDLVHQGAFAREARRVAPRLWIQTPAKSFPVEPHFISLGLHFLPRSWQAHLVRWLSVWGWVTRPDRESAKQAVLGVRLLTRGEMARLFPDCRILTERFCLLPKAYIAVR
jgi:SAM-dependent methyltransferase